jgi:hypothetical protein
MYDMYIPHKILGDEEGSICTAACSIPKALALEAA